MSISFSGVGSGLPVNDWIEALMQTERKPVQNYYTQKTKLQTAQTAINTISSKFSSLRTALEKLTDGNLSPSFDLFNRKSASVSDTDEVTATVANNAAVQSISLFVESLATPTIAKSIGGVAKSATGDMNVTDLSNGQGTAGTFSIYINGVKNTIKITNDEDEEKDPSVRVRTLNDVAEELKKLDHVTDAGVNVDGQFYITFDESVNDVKFGSSADTSNFLNVAKLSTIDTSNPAGKTLASEIPLSGIKTSGTIVDGGTANLISGITAGTFKIGKAEFTIDENTTLDNLLGAINSSKDAGVTAQYDIRTNKIILTSKTPGKVAINLENGTSNFLTKVGLIDESGNSTASQTLGNNAKVRLNGSSVAIEANSNTLTSDITGYAGVTINLKAVSTTTNTININYDTTELTNAINNFISKFNDVINQIDTSTASGATLSNEYSLVRFKSDLRYIVGNAVGGIGTYNTLASIGITTGKVGTSVETKTNNLVLDSSKLADALNKNPEEVRKLLLGDKANGIEGILQKLESKVESLLDPVNGYFTTRKDSISTTITNLEKTITRAEERLEKRKEILTAQFTQMDQYIQKMQSYTSYF